VSHPEGLAAELISRIKGKTVVIGVGNIIKGDDGLGPKLIAMLKDRGVKAPLFDCGTAPENYIFPILTTSCDTVIIVDAADLGLEPGQARVIGLERISTVSFSTHNPSPRLFTDLLKTGKEDMNIFLVAVQPKSMILGEAVNDEVIGGLEVLADALYEALM